MKISIAMRPDEVAQGRKVATLLNRFLKVSKTKETGEKDGYLHIYISTKV